MTTGAGGEVRAALTVRPVVLDLNLHGWLHERKIPGISVGVHQMQLVQGSLCLLKAC
jgi:hypothetical protein